MNCVCFLIAKAGLEPARPLRARDFKSPASAIPPLSHSRKNIRPFHYRALALAVNGFSLRPFFQNEHLNADIR